MKPKRVLILGGTGEAAALAARATELPGVDILSSLAGRTQLPRLPSAHTRTGGFGGVAGLIAYLQAQQIDLLVDATHPFAAQISFNAAEAATALGLPRLMLTRPAWPQTAGDTWIEVNSPAAAAAVLPQLAPRIFLAIGRQSLAPFAGLTDRWFLMRMVDPPLPKAVLPPGQVLLARGPFSLEDEKSLFRQYEVGAIVSKNSGGLATYAKIMAARELSLPVVMIQRPPAPSGQQVETLTEAVAWIANPG